MDIKPGAAKWIIIDLAIVRGLGYYTGTVFEAFDVRGEYRAICGGGRYDNLLESLGGTPAAAVGFGWGDVVLTDLLDARGMFRESEPAVDFLVFSFDPEPHVANELIGKLRSLGYGAVFTTKSQSERASATSTGLSDSPRFVLNAGSEQSHHYSLMHIASGTRYSLQVDAFRKAIGVGSRTPLDLLSEDELVSLAEDVSNSPEKYA